MKRHASVRRMVAAVFAISAIGPAHAEVNERVGCAYSKKTGDLHIIFTVV